MVNNWGLILFALCFNLFFWLFMLLFIAALLKVAIAVANNLKEQLLGGVKDNARK